MNAPLHITFAEIANMTAGAAADHIMQFFAYEHLPAHLRAISKPFCELAWHIAGQIPRNPERTVALRKLLEAKDACVRATLAKESGA